MLTFPGVLVRDLTDGQQLDQVLLVRGAERRSRREGGDYLRLVLADRSGQLTAMVWDDVEAVAETAKPGCAVRVCGRFERHQRWGPQLALREVAPAADGSYDLADLQAGPPRSAAAMEADLRDLVATVQNRHLRALLEALLGAGTPTWERFRRAPAAKLYHQAYPHGLLEHSLTVAQGVSAMASTFPGIDRDVAVAGALLHDIGKLDAYTADAAAIDLTDAGRLQGEIPLGYHRVRETIAQLPGFPAAAAQAVLHIVLSHHGALEHGSPVVPCTREAWLVHMVDNLGGKLGSFDRLELGLAPGASWSAFDRGIGSSAYFARSADDAQRAA